MTEIPPDDTMEKFDFLLGALVEESILQGVFGENQTAVEFHAGLLRAAYQRALERQADRVRDETNHQE
jgi:hypothetical protein